MKNHLKLQQKSGMDKKLHGRFLMGFEDKYMACRRPFLMLRIKKMEKLITLGSDLYVSIVIICSIQIEEAQMVHGFNIIL